MRPAVTISDAITHRRPGHDSGWHAPAAFTLVELLVTMVIIAMLASLTLAGLAGARQRAKIDKTRSTIRKINEIILPQYESYLMRRVPAPGTTRTAIALSRLLRKRQLMTLEMPDQWADVGVLPPPPLPRTAPMIRYSAAKPPPGSPNLTKYQSAECLAMIVTRGGFNPDATEVFRNDEIGDIDKDGAPELWDGWGRPIAFIRWPAGYQSVVQPNNATTDPDPLDPMRVTGTPPDYGLVPLIYSAGPDEATNDPTSSDPETSPSSGYGLVTSSMAVPGWAAALPINASTQQGAPLAGSFMTPNGQEAARDNVTNHDLLKK
jgi:prepilin-type N-terminal cleavage/methylation domain-containing protein